MWINYTAIFIIIAAGYIFWLRPLLKQKPSLKRLYDYEGSFSVALGERFVGIKQKLTGAVIILANAVVMFWDNIAPALSGVDTTPITSMVPTWVWPLLAIAGVMLLNYFRSLADKRPPED